jgi:hypothetical protein
MTEYRILERRTNADWVPFGIAYEREGRSVLFAPPWRADRGLAVASLEELDERHCPSEEFRWRAVETTTETLTHPIEVLQHTLAAKPGAETFAVIKETMQTPQGEAPVEVKVGKGIEAAMGKEAARRSDKLWQRAGRNRVEVHLGAIAQLLSRLKLRMKRGLFRWQWRIGLSLPSELRQCVAEVAGSSCEVLAWQEGWIERLEQALSRLPRALVDAAGVRYVFVAEDLRDRGAPRAGVAYELLDAPEPKWVGFDASLFQHEEDEPFLQAPLLDVVPAEEFAHVWDYRLEAARSPYSSAGDDWQKIERDYPFDIPNRKSYDLAAEDWASAVVWYLFQREELQRISPERDAFVARLFRECLKL